MKNEIPDVTILQSSDSDAHQVCSEYGLTKVNESG